MEYKYIFISHQSQEASISVYMYVLGYFLLHALLIVMLLSTVLSYSEPPYMYTEEQPSVGISLYQHISTCISKII